MADSSSFMLREARRRSGEQFMECARAAERVGFVPVFTHATALRYQGIAVPEDCTLPGGLHISFESRAVRHRFRYGSRHCWSAGFEATLDERGGFFVSNPAMTWAQMAMHVSEESLAVIAGAMTCRDASRRLTTLDDLQRYVRDNPNFRGRRRCEAVMPFLLENADSPPESALAVMIMKAGLGTPVANVRVDLPSGRYRLLDLSFPDLKLAIEYQGAYHAAPAQMRADAARWNELRALGWEIVLVTADDLRDDRARAAIVELIRALMNRQSALLHLARVA